VLEYLFHIISTTPFQTPLVRLNRLVFGASADHNELFLAKKLFPKSAAGFRV